MIRVIQVGIGGMGGVWLDTVLKSDEVEFVGFVEISDAVIDAQVLRFGLDRLMIYRSLDEALAAVDADGVINVTPPQFHREVSIQALEAGLPVLSEKPLAPTLLDAQAIVAASARTGVLHMVTQNYRYSSVVHTLKRVLASGEMGAVGALNVEFFKGPHFGGFREEMPYPLIIDMAIHHFDLMRYLLDADALSVFGRSWNPAWSWFRGDAAAAVLLNFPGEVMASYNGSWCAIGRETTWNGNWRFDCEDGVVALIDDQVWIYPRDGDGTPRQVDLLTPPHVSQAYLLHEFYEALTTGSTPATICTDNIKSLEIVFGVLESFEMGKVVRL